jgi:hypothetical protein
MAAAQEVRLPRRLAVIGGLVAFFLGQSLGLAEADADALLRRFNFWGRFRPGSWVVVRHAVETLDADGRVVATSNTETRTTLAGVDEQCLTLRVQASLEVGGKKLDGPTQELRQGPNGDRPEQPAVVTFVGEEDVRVQDRTFRCRMEQSELTADGKRTVTRIWTSPEAGPFELRRNTAIIDVASGKLIDDTTIEVTSLPQRRILARFRPVAEVAITRRHPHGLTTARGVNCPDVPGGVVSQSAEDFGPDGKLLRRTKIELVDFETK